MLGADFDNVEPAKGALEGVLRNDLWGQSVLAGAYGALGSFPPNRAGGVRTVLPPSRLRCCPSCLWHRAGPRSCLCPVGIVRPRAGTTGVPEPHYSVPEHNAAWSPGRAFITFMTEVLCKGGFSGGADSTRRVRATPGRRASCVYDCRTCCRVFVAGHGHFSNTKGTGHHVDLGSSSSEPKAVRGSFVSAPFAANLAFSISYSGCSGAQHGPGTLW